MGNAREWGDGAEMRLAATCSEPCLEDSAASELRMRTLLARAARQPLGMNLIYGIPGCSCEPAKKRDVKKNGTDGREVKLSTGSTVGNFEG